MRTSQASGYYALLLKNFPQFKNNGIIFNELAVLELLKNNPDKAASFFFLAAKLAPDNPDIIRNCAIYCDFNPSSVRRYLSRISRPDFPTTAKDYYSRYLKLTSARPELESERLAVEQRLSTIR